MMKDMVGYVIKNQKHSSLNLNWFATKTNLATIGTSVAYRKIGKSIVVTSFPWIGKTVPIKMANGIKTSLKEGQKMREVKVLIVGTSRFVECAKKGPAGAAYNTGLTKCTRCKHHQGMEVTRDKYNLVTGGHVRCSYGHKSA
jgi:hypothetical protein